MTTEWQVGDRVEVYDPDMRSWFPGVIESVMGQIAGHSYTIVHTDVAKYKRLPLKIAVPESRPDWIRMPP